MIYIVDLEGIDTRYTAQWKTHVPALLKNAGHEVVVISGPLDIPEATTPGAFLNFGGTNVYKAVQIEKISRLFCNGSINNNDYFLFTDAWHPGIINLKYMSELLGIKIKIGALWHAGSYDPHDFLGRLIGDAPWVRHTEKALFNAIDHNYFATNFHIRMFAKNLLDMDQIPGDPGLMTTVEAHQNWHQKVTRTGWPMEYMKSLLVPYMNMEKRNLILFPHRIAPEKQVEIFRDLKHQLPQYEFIVCQDQQLTKNEYHNLLGEAKLVFSANLQETLGIGCFEGTIVDAIPMVPDRLSYSEMYVEEFKYPSEWTLSYDKYTSNRSLICDKIIHYMENYKTYLPKLKKQTEILNGHYFSSVQLLTSIRSVQ